MKRIPRPTPAFAVAMLALFVALGGTGYAITSGGIPDSHGVFHACVNRTTGAVRLVDNASACQKPRGKGKHHHPGELAVQWSQTGPAGANGRNGTAGTNGTPGMNGTPGANGSSIFDRTRGSGPATTSNAFQGSSLSGNTWTQAANELDTIIGQTTVQEPSSSGCSAYLFSGVGFALVPGTLTGQMLLDGQVVATLTANAGGGTQTIQFAPAANGTLNLFEPGTATKHTLTAQFEDNCGIGGNGATDSARFDVTNVSIDVEGAH